MPTTKYYVTWDGGHGEGRTETSAHNFIDRSTLLNLQLGMPLSDTWQAYQVIMTVTDL